METVHHAHAGWISPVIRITSLLAKSVLVAVQVERDPVDPMRTVRVPGDGMGIVSNGESAT